MADKWKCPFCKSEELRIPTPYLNKHGEIEYTYCCLQQKINHDYLEEHKSRWSDEEIDTDEISKF